MPVAEHPPPQITVTIVTARPSDMRLSRIRLPGYHSRYASPSYRYPAWLRFRICPLMSVLLTSSNRSVFRRFLPSTAYRSFSSLIGTIHRSDFLLIIGLPWGSAPCSPTASCAESEGSQLFRRRISSSTSMCSTTPGGLFWSHLCDLRVLPATFLTVSAPPFMSFRGSIDTSVAPLPTLKPRLATSVPRSRYRLLVGLCLAGLSSRYTLTAYQLAPRNNN